MDLRTKYLGLDLKNPLVASASPLGRSVDGIRKLEDAGAAAVVLPSIFQEEIDAEIEHIELLLAESDAEALTYFPMSIEEKTGPEQYLNLVRQARESVDIPVIASLNGSSLSGWVDYAREVEQAGASAIELNVFFLPTDIALDGREVEQRHVEILNAVKREVSVPVSVKLSPFFSSTGHVVLDLDRDGADGFVLFNRFYQPDIDLEEMTLLRDVKLSTSNDIRLPLLWIGALFGKVRGSLAASSGVQSAKEVLKFILAGADVVMTASALLRNGEGYLKVMLNGLVDEMTVRELPSVAEIRGKLSRGAVKDRTAFDRGNYIRILRGARIAG